jgi:hypothetical protein
LALLWVAQQEFLKEIGAEHQRMLVAFEEVLRKNEALQLARAVTSFCSSSWPQAIFALAG